MYGAEPLERRPSQKTRDIHPMPGQCWATVVNGGPALTRHWVDVCWGWHNCCPSCFWQHLGQPQSCKRWKYTCSVGWETKGVRNPSGWVCKATGKTEEKPKTHSHVLSDIRRLIPATSSSPPGMLRCAGLEMVAPEVLEHKLITENKMSVKITCDCKCVNWPVEKLI